ncbi:glutamate synthase large subunit [Marinicella sp. S1101]|uniref:glutamate synthase large subunit n=1 Tax=Marinicella marina TaxID=2996016 RepID=UPI002260B71D|nr:glutamate synthase large subunit [Marinicella marina]MCX7554133.1 glutamate synthase large subunit [Marinicella marina]MDJ1141174.1 glutamate synthase large subunit [Marinicella marina]
MKHQIDQQLMQSGLYRTEFERDACGAGFICSLKGQTSHNIIHKALEILEKLEHRGAVSADGRTGDGAGILIDIPHLFFKEVCHFELPSAGDYAVGNVFFPQKANQRVYCQKLIKQQFTKIGLRVLGWREVPVDQSVVGIMASENEPYITQLFVAKAKGDSEFDFKRKLYAARKVAEHRINQSELSERDFFYLASLCPRTIIYKGLLLPQDIKRYYADLTDERVVTRLALVHQRFSTNTFPTWDLAQPFRYICHNGEINTIKGNIRRMLSREELMQSDFFGDAFKEMLPVVLPGKSDSASLDMVVEMLLMTGRSLPEVMMMLIPEAWEKHTQMAAHKKAFYEYNACLMEPWDGPASIPFTDGKYIGAVLDRNGLRPSRYTVTQDGYVVMSSETGVVDIAADNVAYHGRLEPGKMFLVHMTEGRIVHDDEIKQKISCKRPYEQWLDKHLIHLKDIPYSAVPSSDENCSLQLRKKLFSYTDEDIELIIKPMAQLAKEPIGSMGSDTPVAALSERPQLLYNYFTQLFAQVTNPPLDGIREELVTDISLTLGADSNVFDVSESHCRKLKIANPVISKRDLHKIKLSQLPGLKAQTVTMLYEVEKGLNGLEQALEEVIQAGIKAIESGHNIIILSDRAADKKMAPIPALLACSYLNNGLHQVAMRSQCSVIIESAEPREVHHYAMLFAYGASAVNPYIVNDIIAELIEADELVDVDYSKAVAQYNQAVGKGLLKVMNKIGISTLNSYRGAQIFECVGINQMTIDRYFPGTITRVEGIGLYEIEQHIRENQNKAFHAKQSDLLEAGGQYRWRRNGEKHQFNPVSVAKLQQAVRSNSLQHYQQYADNINQQSEALMTIRGLLKFTQLDPIPLTEVEPWTDIVKRFKTGAMSYGSISQEAHENLAIAMNRIGGKSNSGEGGEQEQRFFQQANGDWKNSAIKQVASGRFGVTSHYLTHASEIQIKMAQGAKPGEGGQLPGAKVNYEIAQTRNSTPYVGLISPPPHHDIYSIEDLSQLIYDLKSANRTARINVKLVSQAGVGTVAAGVAKAKADVILISGFDGGTGAAPLTSLKHAGLPWELGLAEAQQTLVANDLRNRVKLECDGQLKTGRDVAVACLLGAEEFGFATAPLVASGCVMMRACHLNTCPVGIATQNPELRKKFTGKPEHVVNFMYFVAEEMRQIMASLGFRTVDEMVGQVNKLDHQGIIGKAHLMNIDLSPILYQSKPSNGAVLYGNKQQQHELDKSIDFDIIAKAHMALFRKEHTILSYPIANTDRAVGAILSHEISKIHGADGLPADTLLLNFSGSAGQSFAAFATHGVTFVVSGNTNDYLAKGLCGAKVIIKVPDDCDIIAQENIITGNVCLYGATAGEIYINGMAGERFAVRNSGATAVVEGIGDHGCEYMTGGVVVVLGVVGRNFAAGMSGGHAFVYDPKNQLSSYCAAGDLNLEKPDQKNKKHLKSLIKKHQLHTSSSIAKKILSNWSEESKHFVFIEPEEYRQALQRIASEQPVQEVV